MDINYIADKVVEGAYIGLWFIGATAISIGILAFGLKRKATRKYLKNFFNIS